MRRAVGTVVVLGLIGGAVWLGIAAFTEPRQSEALASPPDCGRTDLTDPDYGVRLSTREGKPGDDITISGTTLRGENGQWAPAEYLEVWWNTVSPGGPALKDGPVFELFVTDDLDRCTFEGTFEVPDVEPGTYQVTTSIFEPSEARSYGLFGKHRFTVLPPHEWPEGPFAHNCLPENADGRGDFDGDGRAEVVRFEPVFDAGGHAGWTAVLGTRSSIFEHTRVRVDAECPEVIGPTDVDQDGDDELFFDTGKGMTAALIDLLVYERGKLREVTYRPKATTLYVGTSMAARADLRCFPTEGSPLFEIVKVDAQRQRVTSTNFSLRGDVLVRTGIYPVRGNADGRLRCFGLRWRSY